jgi:CRISPR/Cas system Type II protein with McrA/HNH and RuvC-like nuclease domain
MPHKNYKQWYETEGREYYRKKSAEARKNKLHTKMSSFKRRSKQVDPLLTVANLKAKFGANPVCYLTGIPIDLSNTKSYELDHIIPISRGGDSSLANCGLAASFANQSKRDMTAQEFVALCQQVADHSRTVK